ncbi:hypothetical protein H9L39_05710 [Fusarium oxysporum f. sp. albedinis]|nr:hypothetical protein H9L39_05710 [Fusarium oxysporum f. sp. albedinis]
MLSCNSCPDGLSGVQPNEEQASQPIDVGDPMRWETIVLAQHRLVHQPHRLWLRPAPSRFRSPPAGHLSATDRAP